MISYFQELGQNIEHAWLARHYDEEVFPQITCDILAQNPPFENVGVSEIIDWIFRPLQPFRQPNNRDLFGEPPVMLFQAPRFYIEALFWLSGTTEIHEHAFSGAFTVLAGSSVHSHWNFRPERILNSRMLCGRLERASTEILRPGGIRPIRSGDRLIHQLFHLDLPSVTIVVRTYGDRHHLPQYRFFPPGLAMDSEDREPNRTRRLMLLDGMCRGHIDGLLEYSRQLIEMGEMETLYHLFSLLTYRKVDANVLDELYSLTRERHGEIADLFRQVCDWERRTRIVVVLRSKISDPGMRFLLALLMLMPDRDAIFETIHLQHPDLEPMEAVESWLEGIAGKASVGFELNDVNRLIFRGLVEGLNIEELLERLKAEFKTESLERNHERLLDHIQNVAGSPLFKPLFSESQLVMELSAA